MKIGILTYHYVHNYGALLQAYASCQFLKKLGHQVEIIDYRNPFVLSQYRSWFLHKREFKAHPWKYLLNFFYNGYSRMLRARAFKQFPLLLSPSFSEDLLSTYDIILIGSDQLWNTSITGGYDRYYFADFETSALKIAWAVSLNKLSLEEEMLGYMQNFRHISVREQSLQSLLQAQGYQAELLCDPCMLLGKKDWENLFEKDTKLEKREYVLAYPMVDEDLVLSKARQRAKELGCELLIVWKSAGRGLFSEGFQSLSVQDFVKYIYYAKEIVSSSFHGIALSLCLGKKYQIVLSKPNTRINSLEEAYANRHYYRERAAEMIESYGR